MTQTTTPTEPLPCASATPNPSDILMNLVVTLLTPMFLSVTDHNIDHARMAAIATINAYSVRNNAGLLAIAQIIAFGLAALGSLSLSMADDISLSMTLRLRANANALNRSAEQNRRASGQTLNDDPTPRHAAPEASPDDTLSDAGMVASVAAAAQPRIADPAQSPTAAEKRHQAMWAIAMVKEASELTASIPNLPQAERKAASIRAAILGSTANELLTGASSPRTIPHGRTT